MYEFLSENQQVHGGQCPSVCACVCVCVCADQATNNFFVLVSLGSTNYMFLSVKHCDNGPRFESRQEHKINL